jgi:hypothetical protein
LSLLARVLGDSGGRRKSSFGVEAWSWDGRRLEARRRRWWWVLVSKGRRWLEALRRQGMVERIGTAVEVWREIGEVLRTRGKGRRSRHGRSVVTVGVFGTVVNVGGDVVVHAGAAEIGR